MKSKIFLAALLGMSTSLKAQNTLNYTEIDAYLNNGLELYEKKAYASARKELHTYIQKSEKSLNPNKFNIANAEYYAALASLHSQSKDADVEVGRFVMKNPEHPKAKLIYSDLARSFYDKGQYADAIEYLKKSLENRQDNLDTYELRYLLGLSFYMEKDFKNALTEFDYVKATVAPNAINAAYYAAVINFQNENYDLALSDLKRVENVSPYKTEVSNWIAEILYRQKKYKELLAYAEPIVANPNGRKIDDICLVVGEVYFFENNFEKAAFYYDKYKNFRKGITSDQVTFRHAYSLYKVNSFEKASSLFKLLASQNTAIGQQSAYYLGISSLKLADLTSAMAAFQFAKNLSFDAAIKEEAAYNLVKVLIEKGNNALAISELQAYLKAYPNGKYVDDSNELLSEIFFESNNYLVAITYIEGLPKRTPKIDEAYQKLCYNQAVQEFNKEKFESAIGFFNKSLTKPINSKLQTDAKYWKAEASSQLEKPETEELFRELTNTSQTLVRLKSAYNLGYLYFNKKDFKQATPIFEDFMAKSKNEASLSPNREDVLVRLGDCYLATKNYSQALKNYELALANNKADKDYAWYQKGLTLKYLDRDEEAKEVFDKFSKIYGNSRLIDEALFQNASLEMEKGNYAAAVTIFTDLLRKKPNSSLVPEVLLKRALSFTNLGNHDKAIADYKVIINKFGNTLAAEESLLGIREALNSENRSEEFFAIAEEFKKKNPSSGSVTNLQFDSAKDLFYAEKYEKAIGAFKSFIQTYPGSPQLPEAQYLIAEANYILKNNFEALKYYQEIVNNNQIEYLTKAALRSAAIYYEEQKYNEAISNFQQVIASSSNKRDWVTAWEGLFKAYYFTGNFEKSIEFSEKVISDGGNAVVGAESRASLFKAKAYMGKKDFAQAKIEFEKVIDKNKDVVGAEAKYYIGEMQFKAKENDLSIKTLQELAKDFSEFVFWYEKGFLLIADNYTAKNDSFMAKATLNSIIENSENKQTVELAKQKLKALK
jgi:tetratricopeptide (TPR) repeat protein